MNRNQSRLDLMNEEQLALVRQRILDDLDEQLDLDELLDLIELNEKELQRIEWVRGRRVMQDSYQNIEVCDYEGTPLGRRLAAAMKDVEAAGDQAAKLRLLNCLQLVDGRSSDALYGHDFDESGNFDMEEYPLPDSLVELMEEVEEKGGGHGKA